MFHNDRRNFAISPTTSDAEARTSRNLPEAGFSLIEAVIALLLMMIVALGSASLFSFSIYNNSGGSDRATSLAIAQEAMEVLRSAQFNTTTTDASLSAGTTVQAAVVRDGRTFRVTRQIVNLPSTNAVTTLKGITITVVPQSIGRGWALGAGGTVTLMTQRSMTDR